jgi:RIMS-binding protein 2
MYFSLSGDYILVWGDADEDGFFDGELLDGRRGLVPSNFVEKLEGEELLDFHRQVFILLILVVKGTLLREKAE